MNLDERIKAAFSARALSYSEIGGTLNLTKGRGPTAKKINIDTTSFQQYLAEIPEEMRDLAISGYAEGVLAAMLEPKRMVQLKLSYQRDAGRIMPSIERKEFIQGVKDASGEEPYFIDFFDDLIVTYLIRLDNGLRPLTLKQLEEWNVNGDRVESAGISAIYHSTSEQSWRRDNDYLNVHYLRVGDGFDAARLLVFLDVFFLDANRDFVCGIPDKNYLLFVKSNEPSMVTTLQCAVDEKFKHSDTPLTRTLFSLREMKPLPFQ